MCICEISDRVCKTTEKQLGFTNQMRLKATALKLFILQEQKHKTHSKIQMKKFSCGK